MPLIRCQLIDDAVQAHLTGNQEPTHEARQAAATLASEAKKANPRSLAWMMLNPNESTYFVETDTEGHRYTMVLGWNHAVLLRKRGGTYKAVKVYRWKGEGQAAFGSTADLAELAQDDDVVTWGGQRWRGATPPDVILERVITYGVSSCSFAVLFSTPGAEHVAVSHMSGEPMIPVGNMMPDGVDATWLIASVLPQETEIAKFDSNVLLAAGKLILRGKAPEDGDGDKYHPPMNHTDIGLEFPEGVATLIGTVGMEQNHNYSRLIPAPALARLKNLSNDTLDDDVLFEYGTAEHDRGREAIRPIYARFGHPLTGTAILSAADDAGRRTLTDTRGGRTVRGEIVKKTLPTEAEGVIFDTVLVMNGQRSSRSLQLDGSFQGFLQNANTVAVRGILERQGYMITDLEVTEVRQNAKWTVAGRIGGHDVLLEITKGSECIIHGSRDVYLHKSSTEHADVLPEVVTPLVTGAYGFGDLHSAVWDAVIALYRTRMGQRPYLDFRKSKMDKWEIANVDAKTLVRVEDRKIAFALLIGYYFLFETARQEYAAAIGPIVQRYRWRISIPLARNEP